LRGSPVIVNFAERIAPNVSIKRLARNVTTRGFSWIQVKTSAQNVILPVTVALGLASLIAQLVGKLYPWCPEYALKFARHLNTGIRYHQPAFLAMLNVRSVVVQLCVNVSVVSMGC
jgi:hypothetical protein